MGEALGTFQLEFREAGINRLLEVLGVVHEVKIPPLRVGTRLLGSLSLGGSVTVRDYRIAISDATAAGSARAVPAFTLSLELPRRDPAEVPLDIEFRIPEVIAVGLKHEGSRAYLVLSDLDLSIDLRCPPMVPQRAFDLVLGQLGKLKERVLTAIETRLRRHPIELFDLNDHSTLEIPKAKSIETRLSFLNLEFRDGSLRCGIRVDEAR